MRTLFLPVEGVQVPLYDADYIDFFVSLLKMQIPSIEGLVTDEQLTQAITSALSEYVTTAMLQEVKDAIPSIEGLVTDEQLSQAITSALSEYVTTAMLQEVKDAIPTIPTDHVTTDQLQSLYNEFSQRITDLENRPSGGGDVDSAEIQALRDDLNLTFIALLQQINVNQQALTQMSVEHQILAKAILEK